MKLERRRRRGEGLIELTPLIDVVFLLLIFFMVATTFDDVKGGIKIELPQSTIREIAEVKEIQIIVDKDKNVIKSIDNKELKKVMSSDIAQTVQDYMLNVVNSNLSKWPAFKGTNAGGKTGTADYTLPDGSEATPHSWFISVAPMNDPQIAVAVIVENGGTGSGKAATVASKVVRQWVLGD